jgi:hypothetical protein
MNDDWRLQAEPHESGHARALTERLAAGELAHDLSGAFHDRVIVTRDGDRVFLYAGTRRQAEAAGELVGALAKEHGWQVELELRHWHPVAEEWEDPDAPLPADAAAELAEHEERIAAERHQTEESGQPELEVRIDLPSHGEADRCAERLRGEGLPVVHRSRYVLIGVTDEDAATQLAERLRGELPGAEVKVEGTWRAAYAEQPPNPFAVLGGLGA